MFFFQQLLVPSLRNLWKFPWFLFIVSPSYPVFWMARLRRNRNKRWITSLQCVPRGREWDPDPALILPHTFFVFSTKKVLCSGGLGQHKCVLSSNMWKSLIKMLRLPKKILARIENTWLFFSEGTSTRPNTKRSVVFTTLITCVVFSFSETTATI